jgi:CubicO group peptidase (beta-lactamase class C family)
VVPLLSILLAALALSSPGDPLPYREPAALGMSADRLAVINRIVRKGIDGGGFPGAAVLVGRGGYVVYDQAFGRTTWTPGSKAVSTSSTIYDLASLTKVVATTSAAMILFDQGKLDLDAPVQRYLPEFRGARKDRVTVRHLLTHRAALPPGLQLSRRRMSITDARKRVLEAPLRPYCAAGECFEYSDLGMIILGYAIEKISGERLDAFVAKRVFQPLGMTHTMFKPAMSLRSSIAPTAHASPRGHALQGEVHDESSYALGEIVGHAGLFSTASDLSLFAQMLLNRGTLNGTRVFADTTVDLFTRLHRDNRALGWETPSGVHGSGDYLSGSAFGHTGFTGTSMWIDPERQMFVVLLSNRVYAPRTRRSGDVIADVRNDVTDAAALSITGDDQLPAYEMPAAFRSDTTRVWGRPPTTVRRAPARSGGASSS